MFLKTGNLTARMIVGKRMRMTFSDNRTSELWRSFMPRRKEIINTKSSVLYSIQIYGKEFDFRNFDPEAEFEKWAGVEVEDFNSVPAGMETFVLEEGLYAVFLHKGPAGKGEETFRYIFSNWLPQSGYLIDNRPHFEILGEKYKNDDPASEEEIWIPVKHG
jgi:AraC family transcriptional regulator